MPKNFTDIFVIDDSVINIKLNVEFELLWFQLMFDAVCQMQTTTLPTTLEVTATRPQTDTSPPTTAPTTTEFLWPWERTEKSTTERTEKPTSTMVEKVTTQTEEPTTRAFPFPVPTVDIADITAPEEIVTTATTTAATTSTTTNGEVGSGDAGTTDYGDYTDEKEKEEIPEEEVEEEEEEEEELVCNAWGFNCVPKDQPINDDELIAANNRDLFNKDELRSLKRIKKRLKREVVPSCVGLTSPHQSSI